MLGRNKPTADSPLAGQPSQYSSLNNVIMQNAQNVPVSNQVQSRAPSNILKNQTGVNNKKKQQSLFDKEIAAFLFILALIAAEFILSYVAKGMLEHSAEIANAGNRLGNLAQTSIGGLGSTDYTQGFDVWMQLFVTGLPVIMGITGIAGGFYMTFILPQSYENQLKNQANNGQSILKSDSPEVTYTEQMKGVDKTPVNRVGTTNYWRKQ